MLTPNIDTFAAKLAQAIQANAAHDTAMERLAQTQPLHILPYTPALRGISNKALDAMPPAQLQDFYASVCAFNRRENYLGRARNLSDRERTIRNVARSAEQRCAAAAQRRGIIIRKPAQSEYQAFFHRHTTPVREISAGDTVQVTYRDHATQETVHAQGTVERVEWSQKVGAIYHTRVNGQLCYLSKFNLKL